ESAATNHSESFAQRLQEIERITRERDTATAKATALDTSLATANTAVTEKEIALKSMAESRADLEKRLAASQQRAETLDRDLIVARAEIAERVAAALRMEAERDEQINRFAASEARAVEIERRTDDYQETIRQLQEE